MVSLSKVLFTVLPYLWRGQSSKQKCMVITAFTLVGLTIGLNLCAPLLLKAAVTKLSQFTAEQSQTTILLLMAYGACWTCAVISEKCREMIFFKPVSRAISDFCLTVFKHIHSQSLTFHLGRETGKVAGSIERSQLAIAMLITNLLFRIVPVFVETIVAFFILWHFYGTELGVVVLTVLICYLIVNSLIMGIFKNAERKYQEIDLLVDKQVIDSLLNADTIKYLAVHDYEYSKADRMIRNRENAIISVFWAGTFTTVVQALVLGSGLIIISYLIGQRVLSGELKVGDFVLVNGYLLMLFNPLEQITGFIRNTLSNTAKIGHAIELLATSHIIPEKPHAKSLSVQKACIEFKNITFSYLDDRIILNNFNLTIPAGKTTAIVGASGSGKSTLSRLLFRFYDPNSGKILIDGQDIKKVQIDSLRKCIAAVPQDIVLLNKSLKYNLSYGNFSVSDAELSEVVHKVHLNNLIESLPNGLDTIVGERGVKLSGGERQRVAIARALLKKPRILIFDEATSSLDTNTEASVQTNIEAVSANVTTLLIAHRLTTVIHADQIVVLSKGQIVESGTHLELLADHGYYAELWRQQNA